MTNIILNIFYRRLIVRGLLVIEHGNWISVGLWLLKKNGQKRLLIYFEIETLSMNEVVFVP